MTNIDWTTPRFVDLPDLRMAVFEAGSPSSTHPTIILCHGFPEIAYSWRHIITPLADLGFHVIAPDLRGFGATGNPISDTGDATGVTLFDMHHLCDDMAHLLDPLQATWLSMHLLQPAVGANNPLEDLCGSVTPPPIA